jgi:LmbE family N-acetylglucosaminyl deacetylase
MKDFFRLCRQKILRFFLQSRSLKDILTDKNILIIAPHPDDETFGCAGLIALKVKQNVKVSVLFLTNGEKSLEDVPAEEIMLHRQNSARAATEILGVKDIYFMNLVDGAIPHQNDTDFSQAVEKLATHIAMVDPAEVFCTHIAEGWSDHTAAAELTIAALKKLDRPISLYMYWVWVWFSVPLKGMRALDFSQTYYLDILDVIQEKKSAMHCYLNALHVSGVPYCGRLPKMFLKAFDWPYEVFEKVEYK